MKLMYISESQFEDLKNELEKAEKKKNEIVMDIGNYTGAYNILKKIITKTIKEIKYLNKINEGIDEVEKQVKEKNKL